MKTLGSLISVLKKNITKDTNLNGIIDIVKMYNGNDWKKYVNFKNDTYNKELIYRNNYFEMVLISWKS